MKGIGIFTSAVVLAIGIVVGGAVEYKSGLAESFFQAVSTKIGLGFAPGHSEARHDRVHSGEQSVQSTIWDEDFEIFMEHPRVVVNEPVEFVIHVSDVRTGLPQQAGPMKLVLQDDAGQIVEHVEPSPVREGIFIPTLAVPTVGQWRWSLVIPFGTDQRRVVVSPITVYASDHDAVLVPAPKEVEGLSFLKEAQWAMRTLTRVVSKEPIGQGDAIAIPESALVHEGDQIVAYVQLAGETFGKRYLELGQKANASVEVLSGLAEGERVVVRGAYALAHAERAGSSAHAAGGHEHELASLSAEKFDKVDIRTTSVDAAKIEKKIHLSGEVVLNGDRLAHIVPTIGGVVREVRKTVGDTVRSGEVIAWLESTVLGQTKADYLSKYAELSCCTVDLTRAQEVHENTTKLLDLLASSPPVDALRQAGGAMGENRSDLISAYAELTFAKATYDRENRLRQRGITTEDDFLKAQTAWKKADALYAAQRDSIAFGINHGLLEAQRVQRLRQLAVDNAERNLHIFGFSKEEVALLQALAKAQASGAGAVCLDPNCPDCKGEGAVGEQAEESDEHHHEDERVAWYPLRAPFEGTIIARHITLGESLQSDVPVFQIADLSTVWVDFRVHLDDLDEVRVGQPITVQTETGSFETAGRITYVAPVVDPNTRTATARLVLPNAGGRLRPGQFVSGVVTADTAVLEVAVDKAAIQYIKDQPHVFVRTSAGYEPRAVELGRSDANVVEIVAGLEPGEEVATDGSFHVKSESERRKTPDSGHGHVH